jgi:chromosome segregation ATPase
MNNSRPYAPKTLKEQLAETERQRDESKGHVATLQAVIIQLEVKLAVSNRQFWDMKALAEEFKDIAFQLQGELDALRAQNIREKEAGQ